MRLRAVIAVCLASLSAGCAAARPRGEAAPTPEQLAMRQQWSQAAQVAINRKDWPQAQAALERLLAETPRSAEVHHRLGLVYRGQGRLDAAEAAYRRALQIDPDYVDALIGVAEVEARLGRLEA